MLKGRLTSLVMAGIVAVATPLAACGNADPSDAWRPCSSESFDAAGLFRTFELEADDFEPTNVERAAVCRYGETVEDEAELSDDRVRDLHDALARATDLSSDCPATLASADEVLIVVVDLEGREENAQFNFAAGDVPCESVILRGRSVAADELGTLVRGWVSPKR